VTRLVRIELEKLRTIRLPFGLLTAAAALTVLITVLKCERAGTLARSGLERPALDTAQGLANALTSTDFAMLMALIFGVIVTTNEFRHSTATTTYLGVPDRARVLVAKSLAGLVGGAIFGALAAALTTAIGLAFVAAKGYPVVLGGGTIARYGLGATLGSALLAVAGVAVGTLIRGQVASIVAVFAWGFVVEQIVGGLYNVVQPYLPYTAALTLAGGQLAGGVAALPFAAAVALVAGVAVALAVAAARTTMRRDIA